MIQSVEKKIGHTNKSERLFMQITNNRKRVVDNQNETYTKSNITISSQ